MYLRRAKWFDKKPVYERLSHLEKVLQCTPTWFLVGLTAILVIITSFLADKETNLSGWLPPIEEFIAKPLKVLINNIEAVAIVAAVVLYYKEIPDRRDQRHYEAWQVIDNANGTQKSLARNKALQDLNQDGVSLKDMKMYGLKANVTTPGEGVDLTGIKLKGVDMRNVFLSYSVLRDTDFSDACLMDAKLFRAILDNANLSGAFLSNAFLSKASLMNVNLSEANLIVTNLQGADLRGADLRGANLTGTELSGADLNGAKNWTEKQLRQAKLCNTILPDGCELNPNQNCLE